MMFVFIGSWRRTLWLVVLVFKLYLVLHGGVLLHIMACLLLRDRYVWLYCFSKNASNLVGVCYSFCRLLVDARPLRLVVLVFKEYLEFYGSLLLFPVFCFLLCDHYDWSYWFFEEWLELRGNLLLHAVGCLLIVRSLRLVILVFRRVA